MNKDKHITKVKFLIDKDSKNEVFAYFPEIIEGIDFVSCYAHIGLHSSCHTVYASKCKRATPLQYNDLKQELENIGYNLQII